VEEKSRPDNLTEQGATDPQKAAFHPQPARKATSLIAPYRRNQASNFASPTAL